VLAPCFQYLPNRAYITIEKAKKAHKLAKVGKYLTIAYVLTKTKYAHKYLK